MTKFEPEKIVLFVHGATYASEAGFDVPLNNLSWMDYVAQRGWDVYIMDLRGYGPFNASAGNEQTGSRESSHCEYRCGG